MNYVALHEGKKSVSEIKTDGVLHENSKKLFRGTIDFKKGAAGAVGNEKEDVLLLDDDIVNQTIPLILCAEEMSKETTVQRSESLTMTWSSIWKAAAWSFQRSTR